MTRIRRVAVTAAFVIGSSALIGATAQADASSVIWVDNASGAGCADSVGSGSQAQPYCTIQAAVNVAQAGQTVEVEPGVYEAETTVTTSGTASAPITIEAGSDESPVVIRGAAHAFDVSGASNIVIDGFEIFSTAAEPVVISGASNVTVQGLRLNNAFESVGFENDQIHVTGDSSNIDISRNVFAMSTTTAVQIDAGGSGDTVSTNLVGDVEGDGIVVDSDPGAVVVGNTVDDTCGSGIDVAGSSTGATIENNIVADTWGGATLTCPTSSGPLAGLVVDADAVSGTVANYNDVDSAENAVVDYNWGGTTYPTASALDAATGQGATDSNAGVLADDFAAEPAGTESAPEEKSAAINSANSDAPGELATDVYGDARVDDPLVPNSGAGTYSDYDRGAVQRQDTVSFPGSNYPLIENAEGAQVGQAPTGAPISLVGTAASAWGGSMTYTVDFGDGSTPVVETDGTATHTYTAAGDPSITMTARSSYGDEVGFTEGIEISSAPPAPRLTVTSTGALSVSVDPSASTDPWGIYAYLVDFGDGYSSGSVNAGTTSITHTYAKAGKYTITLTLQDNGGDNAQTTATYTTVSAPSAQSVYALGPSKTSVQEWMGPSYGWMTIGGPASALYAGAFGVFAETPDGSALYKYNGGSGSWTKVGGAGSQFAVSGDSLYGLAPNRSYVARWNGSSTGWTVIGGPAQAIYPAAGGVFATSPGNKAIYKYTSGSWTKVGGAGSQFATSGNTLYGLGPDNKYVSEWNGSKWSMVGGPASRIYAGGAGLFAVNPGDTAIYQFGGAANTWSKVGGGGAAFAVSQSNLFGQSSAGGPVFEYSGTPGSWTNIGGDPASIVGG